MSLAALLDDPDAIVGASGAGKSWTARHKVEQLLAAGRQTIILDPTGVWHGLKSNAAGNGPGFAIPVFGGPRADIPIKPGQGGAVAGILLDEGYSAILDVSQFDEADLRGFALDLLKPLRHRERERLHLVFDEAEEFAPQTAPDDVGFQLVRTMTWIAKRGRTFGLVPTFITQRPADFAKAVLSQVQTLYFHQLIAPADQAPVRAYLKANADKATLDEVMASLPELGRGERWIYSPRRKLLERGITPAIRTFDSMATPTPGQARAAPKVFADLDVSAIAAALSQKGSRAEAGRVIDEAGAALADVIQDRDRRIVELEGALADRDARLRGAMAALGSAATALLQAAEAADAPLTHAIAEAAANVHSHDAVSAPPPPVAPPRSAKRSGHATVAVPSPAPATVAEGSAVRGRKALEALAGIHPARLTETQWALLSGYSRKGGTWGTYKNSLRASGLVEQDGPLWRATAAGVAAIGAAPAPLPAIGPDLARFWGERTPGCRKMVELLIRRWPHFTSREAIAADLGMAAQGGTFLTYLGRLRSNSLLEEKGRQARLSADVMGDCR